MSDCLNSGIIIFVQLHFQLLFCFEELNFVDKIHKNTNKDQGGRRSGSKIVLEREEEIEKRKERGKDNDEEEKGN